ncbi:MAG: ABC transporter substrate-binding protein [Candidatus Binatia bacterium]|nr:MAG: ABC transporter substrate-binding protein [Candidatus Binatia bacterium]
MTPRFSARIHCRIAWLLHTVLLLIVCCGVAHAASNPGNTTPQRIVSLAPSLTELVFALGLGERLVGVTGQCNFPAEALALPKVGTFLMPNVETVLALEPDVVLAMPSPGNRRAVERLGRLGVRLVVVDPQNVPQLVESFRVVGTALGVRERAEKLCRRFVESLEATQRLVRRAQPRRVLFLVGRNPLIAVGRETIQDEVLGLAGATNVVRHQGWPKVSVEFVLRENPEVIIDASMGSEATAGEESAAFWQRFSSLQAVKDGRVLVFADDRVLRPGPRLAEAVRALAEHIHPEVFSAKITGEESTDAR